MRYIHSYFLPAFVILTLFILTQYGNSVYLRSTGKRNVPAVLWAMVHVFFGYFFIIAVSRLSHNKVVIDLSIADAQMYV